jgi:hypothetical protein
MTGPEDATVATPIPMDVEAAMRMLSRDTMWSDVSEFQPGVTDQYPHSFFAFRSHDGGHNDSQFLHNVTWANSRVKSGKLWGYIVYYFYRPGFNGSASLKSRIGPNPNPKMVVMIDVESAGGQVSGNQSAQINREFHDLASYLGNAKRVIGYGNISDLNALWPQKPSGVRLVVAAYGSNPGYPGKFGHQFSDHANVPPFGPSDLNSADGMTAHELQLMFGMAKTLPPPPPPPAVQMPGTKTGPVKAGTGHRWTADGTRSLVQVASYRHTSLLNLLAISAANLGPDHATQMNKYILSGVSFPMPKDLVFYTLNA